jgi:ribosomal protein S18 acetylase RimI-like enzyme
MADDLRLRRYDPRDADAVWRLHRWAFEDGGTDPDDVPGTDDLRRVEAAYLDPGGEFLVGVVDGAGERVPAGADADRPPTTFDGRVVVMGGIVPSEARRDDERTAPDAVELHRMRVAPTHQRAGYGRRLHDALEAAARERGFDRLLATTATTQTAALEFYPALGYAEVGRSTAGDYTLVHYEKAL